jgi:hypothetical protein
MKTINGITLTYQKVERLKDNKVFECILPNEQGYYKSLQYLREKGYVIDNYIDKNLVILNPSRFRYLSEEFKQPQVDWEMLKNSLPMIDACVNNCQPLWNNYIDNLKLFFHLLSTKSTFAKVAYENLKRLNK